MGDGSVYETPENSPPMHNPNASDKILEHRTSSRNFPVRLKVFNMLRARVKTKTVLFFLTEKIYS